MRKIAFLFAITLLAGSVMAQSGSTKSLNRTTTVTPPTPIFQCFTSGSGPTLFSWCVTYDGNVLKLESPAGFEHIYEGLVASEGYGVCDLMTQERYYDYGMMGDSNNWNDSVVTQPNGPGTFPLTISRNTRNGQWKLIQQFSENKLERLVIIKMTLINSVAIPRDVYLARFVDLDANSGNGEDFENWFDSTTDAVTAWNPGMHYASMVSNSAAVNHYSGVFFFDHVLDPCTKPAVNTPVYGDHAAYITHVLSFPALGSKTVTVEYRTH